MEKVEEEGKSWGDESDKSALMTGQRLLREKKREKKREDLREEDQPAHEEREKQEEDGKEREKQKEKEKEKERESLLSSPQTAQVAPTPNPKVITSDMSPPLLTSE